MSKCQKNDLLVIQTNKSFCVIKQSKVKTVLFWVITRNFINYFFLAVALEYNLETADQFTTSKKAAT